MAENFTSRTFLDVTQMDLPSQAVAQEHLDEVLATAGDPAMMALTQENPEEAAKLRQQVGDQVKALQNAVTIEKVVDLLREQRTRPFVLEIETDSTIQVDENTEKQRRTEFLTALSAAIQQLTPLVQAQPAAGPFAAEMIKFAVAPFRAGRAMTAVIEEFTETIRRRAQQSAVSSQPDPEQMQAEADAQRLGFEKQKHADEMALRAKELDQTHEREIRKARIEGDLVGSAAGQPAAYSMSEVIVELAGQNAAVLQALQMIAQVLAAPKTVTTPEGRSYTTQPAVVN
jgi:hypothetical protein